MIIYSTIVYNKVFSKMDFYTNDFLENILWNYAKCRL